MVLRFQPSDKLEINGDNLRVNATVYGATTLSDNFRNLLSDFATGRDVLGVAAQVAVQESPPVEFESIAEFEGLHCVGYIVEKERAHDGGEWRRVDNFKIVGSDAVSFKDAKIAYGQRYRYRIKSVVKLTLRKEQEDLSVRNAIEDLKSFKNEELDRLFSQNEELIKSVNEFDGLTSLLSSGEKENVIKLNDEYSVVSDGFNTKLVNTVSNKAISIFNDPRLRQQLLVSSELISGLSNDIEVKRQQNNDLVSAVNVSYSSIYFESLSSKDWKYVTTLNYELPPPPQSIKIMPNSGNKQIIISWLSPPTKFSKFVGGGGRQQPYIDSFHIYKRNRLGGSWQRIVSNIKDTFYIDSEVNFRQKYIYAISSVDAHGVESFLSIQIQAELNENFKSEKKEKLLKWISGSGLKTSEVNSVIKKFYSNKEKIIAKNNILIRPSETLDENKDYIIRVTSLDTHEQKEFKVSLKNNFNGRIEITAYGPAKV